MKSRRRRYPKAALDDAGGHGFAAFVRDHPTVVQPAPSHLLVRIVLWGLFLLFLALTLGLIEADDKKMSLMDRLLGGSIMCGLFGWFVRDAHKRQVTIGGGRLTVEGHSVPLDAVTKVERQRFLAILPTVAVHCAGSLVQWPFHAGASEGLDTRCSLPHCGPARAVGRRTERARDLAITPRRACGAQVDQRTPCARRLR